jgi:hypothetical protein
MILAWSRRDNAIMSMRNQQKLKRRSRKMCKPHMMGWARRWNA